MDPLAPQPGTKRQLVVWIWYPAAPQQPRQTFDDYLPAPWRAALRRQSEVVLTQFLTRDLSRVRTHGVLDAEVSLQRHTYPVVAMRGGHSALTTDCTTLAEDLASHGYVVVGFDAPYRTFVIVLPNGTVIARSPENTPNWSAGKRRSISPINWFRRGALICDLHSINLSS